MAYVVDIEGPSAVGKTTLIRSLAQEYSAGWMPEILALSERPIRDPANAKEFIENQLWFLKQACLRCSQARSAAKGKVYFTDSGITDVILFTRYWPSVMRKGWNVWDEFKGELVRRKLLEYEIEDAILYLRAKPSTIRKRKAGDGARSRSQHENNLSLYKHELKYFNGLMARKSASIAILNAEKPHRAVLHYAKSVLDRILKTRKPPLAISSILNFLS